jgi:O-antigen ligase
MEDCPVKDFCNSAIGVLLGGVRVLSSLVSAYHVRLENLLIALGSLAVTTQQRELARLSILVLLSLNAFQPMVFVCLFVFAGMYKSHSMWAGLPDATFLMCGLVLASVALGVAGSRRIRSPRPTVSDVLLVLFAATLMVSASDPDTPAFGRTLTLEFLAPGLLATYGLTRFICAQDGYLHSTRGTLVTLAAIFVITAPTVFSGNGEGVEWWKFRTFSGNYLNWGYFSGAASIACFSLTSSFPSRIIRRFLSVLAVLGIVAVCLSGSRGALIAMIPTAGVAVFIALPGERKKALVLATGVGLLALLVLELGPPRIFQRFELLFDMEFTAKGMSARVEALEVASESFLASPVVGSGIGNYGSIRGPDGAPVLPYPHTSLLHVAAELGLVGLALYLAFFIALTASAS